MDLRDKHHAALVWSSRRNALRVICVWSAVYVSSLPATNVSHVHKVWEHMKMGCKRWWYVHRNIQVWAVFVPYTLHQVLSCAKNASQAGLTQSFCYKSFIVCVQTHSSTDLDLVFSVGLALRLQNKTGNVKNETMLGFCRELIQTVYFLICYHLPLWIEGNHVITCVWVCDCLLAK